MVCNERGFELELNMFMFDVCVYACGCVCMSVPACVCTLASMCVPACVCLHVLACVCVYIDIHKKDFLSLGP